MDFNTFKLFYAETMAYYQLIEHDIKCIYAYMRVGDIGEHFDEIENITLGQMIRLLQELDNSDNNPLIKELDYKLLIKMCDNRNHWAHDCFTKFLYEENWQDSNKFKKECNRLNKDYVNVQNASKILEKIRIEYCLMVESSFCKNI